MPPWERAFEYWWKKYIRTWRGSVAYSFVYPIFYLAAMGVGLGGLINRHLAMSGVSLGTSSYLAFVGPGILAGSAMQIAVNESTYPVMGAIKWDRTYLAQITTPLRVGDVLIGHVAFMVARLLGTCAVFCLVLGAFGVLHSAQAVLAVPAAVLTGLSFALPLASFSAHQDSDAGFSTINRLAIVPLFLFSGSFFPTRQLPGFLQGLAEFTPLYHGVALCRASALGELARLSSLGHLGYLLCLCGVSVLAARVSYAKRLEP